jgi:hypothetical protein
MNRKQTLSTNPNVSLDADEIERLTSHYLSEGRKQESWKIKAVHIQGDKLSAIVTMPSVYVSGSDTRGFHLTIFSALEFLSQLMITYAHVWAGLTEKTREGWMLESRTRSVRAIRNAEHIQVEMEVRTMRRQGENLFCVADYRVSDDQDGLFEVQLKGFLS